LPWARHGRAQGNTCLGQPLPGYGFTFGAFSGLQSY